jgi:drug/metabolite transporter (DMT)-like permease
LDCPIDFKDPKTLKVNIIRSLTMSIRGAFYASSQFILPLPVVHTINCSGNLFVFLIDYWLNKVKINSKQSIGIIIGFGGAILVTNSRLLTKMIDSSYQY